MKKTLVSFFLLYIVLIGGCYAPTQIYPDEMPMPIYPIVPPEVKRGEEYSFSIETSSDAICYAGVSYWDTEEHWTNEELPTIQADSQGVCQWSWKIPENTKKGLAEFRGYVEMKTQNGYVFPTTFCIEQCP